MSETITEHVWSHYPATPSSPQRCARTQVRLLGGFEFHHDGHRVQLGASAERLVALLALRGAPVSRARVAAVLWPDASATRAAANLRSVLWRMPPGGDSSVVSSRDQLRLSDGVSVDLHAADDLALRVLDGDMALVDTDNIGVAVRQLLFKDLLPEHTEDAWLWEERERFRQLRLHALEVLCRMLSAKGLGGLAIEVGLAALHADPYRESAHRALIDVHLAEGNRREAARQFEECRRLLHDELGISPSDLLTQRIHQTCLSMDDRLFRSLPEYP
ncbi:transcriptional regulator [Saccharothrix sp. S26]|uniref:AfsR/SARP family transcriptional regulator n=1 Tax=Saccharothrix sp. S26 TaxID=2907215 RepID=UPI001F1FDFE5|nr:BTAD domain-containing putative transcriptional regulator [Saccharothrix sp. S26]MCE7000792.1 transcriptional regulator [Saccharothrix sp. S26]